MNRTPFEACAFCRYGAIDEFTFNQFDKVSIDEGRGGTYRVAEVRSITCRYYPESKSVGIFDYCSKFQPVDYSKYFHKEHKSDAMLLYLINLLWKMGVETQTHSTSPIPHITIRFYPDELKSPGLHVRGITIKVDGMVSFVVEKVILKFPLTQHIIPQKPGEKSIPPFALLISPIKGEGPNYEKSRLARTPEDAVRIVFQMLEEIINQN